MVLELTELRAGTDLRIGGGPGDDPLGPRPQQMLLGDLQLKVPPNHIPDQAVQRGIVKTGPPALQLLGGLLLGSTCLLLRPIGGKSWFGLEKVRADRPAAEPQQQKNRPGEPQIAGMAPDFGLGRLPAAAHCREPSVIPSHSNSIAQIFFSAAPRMVR